jgi:hypothetical protein
MNQRTLRSIAFTLAILFLAAAVDAKSSGDGIWREVRSGLASMDAGRQIVPESYRTFRLNRAALRAVLERAPEEFTDLSGYSLPILELPMPDGTFQRFRIERSLVVEPALLNEFPELGETYRGQGIDDPTATVRFDFLPSGFHSMVLSEHGTVIVDPHTPGNTADYIAYYKRDVQQKPRYYCEFENENLLKSMISPKSPDFHEFLPDVARPAVISGTELRTYRLALAATGEYTQAVGGGTVAGALAAQVQIMNRVNGVYERDVAIRMVIIGNNNLLIYTNGATDPYTNNNGSAMLSENQTNVDSVIGAANYDIGHVFSTAGGGIATLNGPCGSTKARGATGLPNPTGDIFAIDFVSHEMGHQWGANHTFNGQSLNCAGSNRSAGSAYEPGSGISIMGYAGICGNQDLAASSIDSFHVKSIEAIVGFTTTGQGNTCAAVSGTGNAPPTVSIVGGTLYNIPRLTPFTLTASASDPNGDAITYDWQQYDLGPGTTSVPNSDSDGNARPIFRVFSPTTNPTRIFPSGQFILQNGNTPPNTIDGFLTGETLPTIARTMNFQVIARDNRANGGGVSTASAVVNVSANGPFKVDQPNSNITWYLNSTPTVLWSVGGSNGVPVNATHVRILLSTDGGLTYPIVLADNTPNDGSEVVSAPNLSTTNGRVRIEAVGNIFFDVGDVNFTIVQTPAVSGDIAGRIATAGGLGVPRIYVVLTGGNPAVTRVAQTNAFGYYRFIDIPFAQYTLTPQPQKRLSFNPTSINRNHGNEALDVDFVGVQN